MAKKPNLSVTLIDGEFLVDVDEKQKKGKMDPFINLSLGSQKYETKVALNQGKTPKWNETFNFNYDEKNFQLDLVVQDKDGKNQKVTIGNASCNLLQIEKQHDWSIEVDVLNKSIKQGIVRISFDFIGKKPPPPPINPPKEAQQQQQEASNNPDKNNSSKQISSPDQQSLKSIRPPKQDSAKIITSNKSSYKSINNNSKADEEKVNILGEEQKFNSVIIIQKPIQKLEPLGKLQIGDFKSVAYEEQVQDLEGRLSMILEKNKSKQVSNIYMAIQDALNEGLERIRQERPEDQITFFGQFLSNYSQ